MTPRIAPLEPPYAPDVDAQLRSMVPPGVDPIGLFRTFARNLPMARAMSTWGRYELGRELSVDLRTRELVIDRTCARCGCEYEWGVHVAFFAERAGLDAEQVRSLTAGGPDDPCWTEERDRLAIRLVDALHDSGDVDDATWAQLSAAFPEEQLLDLVMLTGWYHAIAWTAVVARVQPEPWAPRFATVTAPGVARS